jgi:hypothetical protein
MAAVYFGGSLYYSKMPAITSALRYLAADAETALCCAECNHQIRINSPGTFISTE